MHARTHTHTHARTHANLRQQGGEGGLGASAGTQRLFRVARGRVAASVRAVQPRQHSSLMRRRFLPRQPRGFARAHPQSAFWQVFCGRWPQRDAMSHAQARAGTMGLGRADELLHGQIGDDRRGRAGVPDVHRNHVDGRSEGRIERRPFVHGRRYRAK